jgi:hypothetical protein
MVIDENLITQGMIWTMRCAGFMRVSGGLRIKRMRIVGVEYGG